MREDHRRSGRGERRPHRALADVRQIDQHPDPVQLQHHLLAEIGEAVVPGIVGRRIRPVDRARVGERQIAGAERGIGAQDRQIAVDLPAALDPHHRGDLARSMRAAHVGRGARQRKGLGVTRDDRLHEVDLLQRLFDLLLARQIGRDIDRPELPAELAAPQPRDIGVIGLALDLREIAEVDRPAFVALAVAQRLGPVVMPVDQRGGAEDTGDARGIILRRGRDRQQRDAQSGGQRRNRRAPHAAAIEVDSAGAVPARRLPS